jgi:hypothetical protein
MHGSSSAPTFVDEDNTVDIPTPRVRDSMAVKSLQVVSLGGGGVWIDFIFVSKFVRGSSPGAFILSSIDNNSIIAPFTISSSKNKIQPSREFSEVLIPNSNIRSLLPVSKRDSAAQRAASFGSNSN